MVGNSGTRDPRRFKFTARAIEAKARAPHPARIDYRDTLTAGLQFRVGPRAAAWYYVRRIDGKLSRLRLGTWPDMRLSDARARVGELEDGIEAGRHPAAEIAREQSARREQRTHDQERIVRNLAEAWRAAHFPEISESTRRDYRRLLGEFVTRFDDADIGTIQRGDIVRHLDTVKARSASEANRALVVIRQLFAYAQDRHDLDHNPASNIKVPAKPKRRSRTLDRQEIRILWRACELAGYPYGHALRMALCTGQRIGEVGAMRWDGIEDRYWRNTDNKTDQRIDIYLAGHAKAIIDDCPRIGDYVFTRSGEIGLRSDTWSGKTSGALARHIWPAIHEAAAKLGIDPIREHFTAHDLRRTVRTGLTGWAGVLPDTAERVLNHSISGLRAHYDFADYRPHVAEALQRWDAELGRILKGEREAVTPIKKTTAS